MAGLTPWKAPSRARAAHGAGGQDGHVDHHVSFMVCSARAGPTAGARAGPADGSLRGSQGKQ